MKQTRFIVLVILGALIAACSGLPGTAATPTSAPPPSRPAVLRIELPEDPEIPDIARAMAVEAMRDLGYNVETIELSDNTQSVQALEQGTLDIGNINNAIAWSAVQQGAKSISIMDDRTDLPILLARPEIKKCADLDGKQVGVSALASTQALMIERLIAQECPGTKTELVVMAGSPNRLATLAVGQLDATPVALADFISFARQNNQGVHPLVYFSSAFPGVRTGSQVVRRELLESYPETIRDYIRASLLARRQLTDPQVLKEQILKHAETSPAEAEEIARTLLEQKVWDVNGGLTPQVLQANIDFMVASGSLKPGLKPEDVADLSPLNAVLAEIGYK